MRKNVSAFIFARMWPGIRNVNFDVICENLHQKIISFMIAIVSKQEITQQTKNLF